MTQINLLPWRERVRELKKRQFVILLSSVIGFALFLILLLHMYFNSAISTQQSRNDFLQTSITQEQAAITTLNKKKKEQAVLETKLKFLINLRNQSYKAVSLLNELAAILPDNVALLKLTRAKKSINILGSSSSNLQITQFMDNMTKSTFFQQPVLTEISGKEQTIKGENLFQIKAEERE